MAYTDDWESLMNGVFGAGGKLKFGGAQPQPEKPQPEKPAGSGLPDLNAALLEQQKQLDEMLRQQNARLKAQDAGVQTALEDSRRMLRDMEADGLMMIALDAGAEDFSEEDDSFEILTDPDNFEEVRKALEDAGIPMISAEVTMIPQNYVTLTDETAVKNLQRTLDLLEDDDDVQAVYHNWDE